MEKSQTKHTYFCWICGGVVDLETCNNDECGMAVHEDCYFLRVALATESMRLMVRKPPQGIRRVAVGDMRSPNTRYATR